MGSDERRYTLKNVFYCSVEQKMDVLKIRNSDAVRKSMYSEHEIGVNEHLAWIERLGEDARQKVFVVLKDGEKAVGVVSVNQLDYTHKKTDWAFYLSEAERGGLGAALEIFMIDYVFNDLRFEKLNCEVLETNPRVVDMHKRFGFSEEGFREANIEKDGKRIGVHFLGLQKNVWLNQKERLLKDLEGKVSGIELTLSTEDASISQSVIDRIQAARAKNNVNWMNLLRLSVEKNPNQSLPIIEEIMRLDGEINDLTKKLVNK